MKNAYLIGHITVKNKEKWAQYRNSVPATLEPWGAEVVLRGTLCSVLSGTHAHTDTLLVGSRVVAEDAHANVVDAVATMG